MAESLQSRQTCWMIIHARTVKIFISVLHAKKYTWNHQNKKQIIHRIPSLCDFATNWVQSSGLAMSMCMWYNQFFLNCIWFFWFVLASSCGWFSGYKNLVSHEWGIFYWFPTAVLNISTLFSPLAGNDRCRNYTFILWRISKVSKQDLTAWKVCFSLPTGSQNICQ